MPFLFSYECPAIRGFESANGCEAEKENGGFAPPFSCVLEKFSAWFLRFRKSNRDASTLLAASDRLRHRRCRPAPSDQSGVRRGHSQFVAAAAAGKWKPFRIQSRVLLHPRT